ncbi:aldo/keto reductase [Amycolatopsis pithecellobii]|uniref:Aldo/keto reductase n=1 Tax=Amycolatopsis pithecellobii TaxID=664692 RepID=A0A6N7Z9X3_9PSEU|nr:aldo/keto reductase [Amycolatopsis pithecellobii]MTD58536.1 aldo/keto reductase [Amycolatopsis pithecellobii]
MTPEVALNNGVSVPRLGFGVFQVPPADTAKVVQTALETGYRSIDTAMIYRNEAGVGDAIKASGLPREELFVTTKLWNSDQGYDSALRAFDKSMTKLGLDYLDLYLIHWPAPKRGAYVDSWRAFEKLYADGRVRAIGVSNFHIPHLRRLFDETGIVPAVNQVELHPNLAQLELRTFHAEHRIVTEAWSPLAQGALLADRAITGLSAKYGKSPAQIVLRWHLQSGNVVIPKSVTPSRIRENFEVFDFELAPDDLAVIDELDNGGRTGPDPDRLEA